jgi:hypothetical protein
MRFRVVNQFRQVVYISHATATLTKNELNELVEVSRRNNKKYGITGALLYLENAFIQVIEGEDAAISQLLDKLYADTRHRNVRIVSDIIAQIRYFQEHASFPDLYNDASSIRHQPCASKSTGPFVLIILGESISASIEAGNI